jgi:raffinose/stachyose/melibiose transport system substrate-binding protein
MVRRRTFWLGAITLSAVVLLATAVGASARTSGAPEISGTLTLSTDLTVRRSWEILIANFERVYPNVDVNATFLQGGNVRGPAIATQFQAGNAPDVVMMGAGRVIVPSLLEYAQAGQLADLSNRPWAKRVPPWARPLVTYNGKVYGWLQRSIAGPIVVRNRDLFQNLGLTLPRTFPQLLNVCRTIRQKAPNLLPLGFIGALPDSRGAAVLHFASSEVYAKDPDWNAKRARGAVTFQSTPGWRTAVQRLVDMKNAGCFSPSVAQDSVQAVLGQMLSGQAVLLWFSDTGFAALRAANSRLNIDMFVPPAASTQAASYMTVYPQDTLVVNQRAKNMPAALAFVDFMAREKQDRLFSTINGGVSPYDYQRAFNPRIGARALDELHQFASSFATAGRIRVTGHALWPSTDPFLAIGNAVQGLFTGQTTVDDVLRAADNAWPK